MLRTGKENYRGLVRKPAGIFCPFILSSDRFREMKFNSIGNFGNKNHSDLVTHFLESYFLHFVTKCWPGPTTSNPSAICYYVGF